MITSIFVDKATNKVVRSLQMHEPYLIDTAEEFSFAVEGVMHFDFSAFEYVYKDGHIQRFEKNLENG